MTTVVAHSKLGSLVEEFNDEMIASYPQLQNKELENWTILNSQDYGLEADFKEYTRPQDPAEHAEQLLKDGYAVQLGLEFLNDEHSKMSNYGPGVFSFLTGVGNLSFDSRGDLENQSFIGSHVVALERIVETREGKKYYKIKNSYGAEWGDEGYANISCVSPIFTGVIGLKFRSTKKKFKKRCPVVHLSRSGSVAA